MINELTYLAIHLRDSDALEISRSSKLPASTAIAWSWRMSSFRRMYLDGCGKPGALIGVADVGPRGHGCPWMLATDAADAMPLYLWRESKNLLQYLQSQYRYLSNFVDAENATSIRWLERLGFHIAEPVLHGPFDFPFREFSWGVK